MDEPRFEWDERKNRANRRKHGVAFDEAASTFADDQALLMADDEHSSNEDRFMLLGISERLRFLVVCHTYRANDNVIRIISARKASNDERQQYFDRWQQ